MLEEALAIYNEQHKNNKIALTPQMKSEFQATNMIGVPFSVLPQVMAMSVTERDKFMGDMTNPRGWYTHRRQPQPRRSPQRFPGMAQSYLQHSSAYQQRAGRRPRC